MLRTATLLLAAPLISFHPALAQSEDCPWEKVLDAPLPRVEAGAIEVDGRMWVLGGFYNGSLQVTDRVDVLDPQTMTWSLLTTMPNPLTHQGVAQYERQVWVVGGFVGDNPGPVTDEVWIYDIDADQWSAGPSLPEIRGSGALVALDGLLHWFGGVGTDKDVDEPDHWAIDPAGANQWVPLAPLPQARNHVSGAAFDGRIYAIGGQFRHNTNPDDQTLVHCYDPQTDQWSQVADLPFGRSHAEPSTFVDPEGIVLAGGRSTVLGLSSLLQVQRYVPGLDQWLELPPLPEPLIAPVMRYIDGLVHISGGGPSALDGQRSGYRRQWDDFISLPLSINAGRSTAYAGTAGDWCYDYAYVDGRTIANPGAAIANTDDQELYRTERQAPNSNTNELSYRFLVNNGDIQVTLHFAETFWGATNRRKFDVSAEGILVLDDYDIIASAGSALTADVQTFVVQVSDGALDLEFVSSLDRPSVCAIELEYVSTSYCVGAPNSAGPGAVISYTGSKSVAANDLVLQASPVPDQPGIFYYGPDQLQLPFGDGFRCVGGMVGRLPVVMGTGNVLQSALDITDPPSVANQITAGSTWNFQAWFRDPAAGGTGFNLSDAIGITFTN